MKAILLAVVIGLVVVPAAAAHGKHKRLDPSFTCTAGECTFLVEGLTPGVYQASLEYRPSDGSTGCNVGESARPTDTNGVYTLTVAESFIECAGFTGVTGGPGTVTAWVRAGDSSSFSDPPVTLSDGSPVLVVASV